MVRYSHWIKRGSFTWKSNQILTSSLESSLCDYSDAYVLVTGNIAATPNNAATQVVFKNCAPFKDCRTEINDTFVDYADFINITMPMYNLIEYSDNYSDTSGSLWQFKRDEIEGDIDLTVDGIIFQIIRHHLSINQVLLRADMV